MKIWWLTFNSLVLLYQESSKRVGGVDKILSAKLDIIWLNLTIRHITETDADTHSAPYMPICPKCLNLFCHVPALKFDK